MEMVPDIDQFDSNWLARFRRNLRRWYGRHARDLPWRRTTDPYHVWISEIMLQQTTVAAVVPYFERFVARFPTLADLAAGDEDEVLRHWEGLGYYSRARNIHKTAGIIVSEHGGRFPAEVERLAALPGIGRYTAGAIVSFAFDRPAPIVEANTLRAYSRLLGYRGDPRSAAGQRLLWAFAEQLVPPRSPGRFNHALMELGATLCRPADPGCPRCPVRSCCRAFAEGTQAEIPRPAPRPEVTAVTEASVAVHCNGAYLLRRRGPGERWAGLWDFQRFPLESAGDAKRTLETRILQTAGVTAEVGELLAELHHSVTRYRIRLLCYLAEHLSGPEDASADLCWVRPADFDDYPLSVTGRKFARLLAGRESPPI